MRKTALLLIGALVFTLLCAGCAAPSGTAETTTPSETTLPVVITDPAETAPAEESTAPPETSQPSETTVPPATEPSEPSLTDSIPFHESYTADGFVYYCGEPLSTDGQAAYYMVYYTYAGDSPVIELSSMGAALTLPEGWLDRVCIFRTANPPYNESIYVINKNLYEAYREGVPENPYNGLHDYLLCLSVSPISRSGEPEDYRADEQYLCETDELVFFVSTAPPEGSTGASLRTDLIQKIGQDAYDALVGDLIVTEDMIRTMITIHEAE